MSANAREVFFRRLRIEDAPILGGFFERNNVPAVTSLFSPFPLTSATAESLLNEAEADLFFGLFQGGRIVAFSMLRGMDEGYQIPSFGLFVDHDFQRLGLGRKLLQFTCRYADIKGFDKIRLSVFEDNEGGKKLYGELGFVVDSEEVKSGRRSYVMFRTTPRRDITVYASTSCLFGAEPFIKKVEQWVDAGLLNIECSFFPGVSEEALKQAQPCTAKLMLHGYIPFGDENFCFNLASPSQEVRENSIAFAKERLRISRDLGASFYAIHAGFVSDPVGRDSYGFVFPETSASDRLEAEKIFADAIAEVASYAKDVEVTLLIENNVMNQANQGKLLFVNPDDFIRNERLFLDTGARILLDIGHANVSACTEGNRWDISQFASVHHLISGMHVHENDGTADQHFPITISKTYLQYVKSFTPEFITLEGRYESLEELQQSVLKMDGAVR
jgi:sugar phosphate isomerase/epimerase/ribosomal protein S18 acetylase RimI-like enzyme